MTKPLYFAENRNSARFTPFSDKIVYKALHGPLAINAKEEDAWAWEAKQRDEMTELLRTHLPDMSTGTSAPPLVLFSDVDEIPSAHTLRLLTICNFPSPIHLQMRNFLYSFEWPYGWSWRPQVHVWQDGATWYRHSKASDVALADSGWHCSFCFRFLEDFAVKMKGWWFPHCSSDVETSPTYRFCARRQVSRMRIE